MLHTLNTISPSLLTSFSQISLCRHMLKSCVPNTEQKRCASHQAQGRANGPRQGPGKRLGAKKGDSELVVPGNIIFRQRGSVWHPGENCVMGRDHTISSLVKGYVRYYRDPVRHKTRKYIGVVFEKNERLPRPLGAPRQRRLGMEAQIMEETPKPTPNTRFAIQIRQAFKYGVEGKPKYELNPDLAIREGYQVRETNKSIGRTAERERALFRLRRANGGRQPSTKEKKRA